MFFSSLIARGSSAGRRLHRHEREHLEEVGHDHVAVGTGRLVERCGASSDRASRARRSGRGRCDRGSRSVRTNRWRTGTRGCSAPPPSRGSGRCGRSAPRGTSRAATRSAVGRCEVGAERLLHDDPRPLDEVGLAQHAARPLERPTGRDAEVVQPRGSPPSSFSASATAAAARGPSARAARSESLRANAAHSPAEIAAGELVARLCGRRSRNASSSRSSSDVPTIRHSGTSPAWNRWNRPGQQLAASQIAGGSEQHDHVRLQGAINDGTMSLGSVWVVTCSDTDRTL